MALTLMMALAWLASCASPKEAPAEEAAYTAAPMAPEAQAVAEEAAPMAEPEMDASSGTDGTGVGATLHSGVIDPSKQKIIRDARIVIETKNYESTVSSLSEKAVALGGYLQSSQSSLDSYDQARSMEMTMRIPYQSFDSFLKSAREGGKVLEESIGTEDVSDVYFDSEARLKSLQIKLERFESIMASSATLEDVLKLESEIADVRYEIERLQGSLNGIDDHVRYSTVTVFIREWIDRVPSVSDEDPNFGERIRVAFGETGFRFVSFLQGVVIALIYLSPLLIIAAIALPFVLRAVKKRRGQEGAKPSSQRLPFQKKPKLPPDDKNGDA